MRITDLFVQNGGIEAVKKSSGLQKSAGKALSQQPKAKDSVSFSKEGKAAQSNQAEAKAIEARVQALPEVREERIQEVQSRIENGYYNTDEFKDALADRLMNDMEF